MQETNNKTYTSIVRYTFRGKSVYMMTNAFCWRYPQSILLHMKATCLTDFRDKVEIRPILTGAWRLLLELSVEVPEAARQHKVPTAVGRPITSYRFVRAGVGCTNKNNLLDAHKQKPSKRISWNMKRKWMFTSLLWRVSRESAHRCGCQWSNQIPEKGANQTE